MPKPPVPANVAEFLAKPNPAVITALGPGGQPVSVATWYVWEEGRILVNMDVTVLGVDGWYDHVSVQGRVTELTDDADLADIDRIARHYTGNPYPVRDRRRVSAWIEIDRWHGWGAVAADKS
jgi:hypothetical protein